MYKTQFIYLFTGRFWTIPPRSYHVWALGLVLERDQLDTLLSTPAGDTA